MAPRREPKNAPAAAAVGLGRDHISNLPDDVLLHLLSFLPAQDVVQTCVLARRWRHIWKSTTVLRFVCGGRMMQPDALNKIQQFVYHLLRQRIHGGTPLDTCEFRLGETRQLDMSRFALWIRIALQCKVRVLLAMSGCDPVIGAPDGHPFFVSQYLNKLQLRGLNLATSGLLDLSCCPNLEDLKIVWCKLADTLLISSQSLKRLTISHYFGGGRRLPICAPNLVSLWIEVQFGRTPFLQRMPSLLTAYVEICSSDERNSLDSDNDSSQSILLQSLSEVQNLALTSYDTKMFVFRRDLEFCSSFNKLKSLLLDEYWCEQAHFSALACLLKLSPVLEKLTLQVFPEWSKHKVEIKLSCKPLVMSGAILQHLKALEVKCDEYDDVHDVLMFLCKQLNICFSSSDSRRLRIRMDLLC